MGCGRLLSKGLMRSVLVVFVHEALKSALLGAKGVLRRLGGCGFEGAMHAFMSSVFLGLSWTNAFGLDAQAQPPNR